MVVWSALGPPRANEVIRDETGFCGIRVVAFGEVGVRRWRWECWGWGSGEEVGIWVEVVVVWGSCDSVLH